MSEEKSQQSIPFKQRAVAFLRDAAAAAKKYPVEILLGFATAFYLSGSIAQWWTPSPAQNGAILAMALVCCIASAALSSLAALGVIGARARLGLSGVVLVGGALYGGFLAGTDAVSEWWRWALLAMACGAGLTLAPLGARQLDASPDQRFWRFNARLLARGLTCVLYAGLMYIGLFLALLLFDVLLDAALHDQVYGHLGAWLFVAGVPWMVMAGFDEIVDVTEPVADRPIRFLARFGSFLLLPLLALYLLIMYGHVLKAAFGGYAPSNIISPLVVGAGLLGYVGLFLLEPLRHREDYRTVSQLFHLFPAAFLPILPLAFWAIFARVGQYGWTEFRHFRLLVILVLSIASIYGAVRLVRRQPMALFVVPALVAVLSMVAAAGPWSLVDMSRRSQLARLDAALEAGGVRDADGRLLTGYTEAMSEEQVGKVRELTRYVRKHFGKRTFERYETTGGEPFETWVAALKTPVEALHAALEPDQFQFRRLEVEEGTPIALVGTMFEFSFYSNRLNYRVGNGRGDITIEGPALRVTHDGQQWEGSLEALRRFVAENPDARALPPEAATVLLHTEEGELAAQIVLRTVTLMVKFDDELRIDRLSGYIVIAEP